MIKLTPAQKALYLIPFRKLPTTKAWKYTSELVRKQSLGFCFTCNQKFPYEKLVAGHFIEKIGNSNTYFDLDNLKAQCSWNCNRQKHGAKDIYAMKLIELYGPNIIKDLFKRAGKSKQWSLLELETIAEERKQMIEELNK